VQNKDSLGLVVHSGDQQLLIPGDMEDRSAPNQIGVGISRLGFASGCCRQNSMTAPLFIMRIDCHILRMETTAKPSRAANSLDLSLKLLSA